MKLRNIFHPLSFFSLYRCCMASTKGFEINKMSLTLRVSSLAHCFPAVSIKINVIFLEKHLFLFLPHDQRSLTQ